MTAIYRKMRKFDMKNFNMFDNKTYYFCNIQLDYAIFMLVIAIFSSNSLAFSIKLKRISVKHSLEYDRKNASFY